MPDPLEVHRDLRLRISDLVVSATPRTAVPACPGWEVVDVLRHLVGVSEDVANGNVNGFGTAAWSAAHLVRNRDTDLFELLSRWEEVSDRLPEALAAVDDSVPGIMSVGIAMTFDALAHEQDIRTALALPPVPTDRALVLMSDISLMTLRERRRDAPGRVVVRLPDGSTVDAGGEGAEHQLSTTRLEVWRALSGRRTRDEVAAMDWAGPPPGDLERTWVHPIFDWPEVPVGI